MGHLRLVLSVLLLAATAAAVRAANRTDGHLLSDVSSASGNSGAPVDSTAVDSVPVLSVTDYGVPADSTTVDTTTVGNFPVDGLPSESEPVDISSVSNILVDSTTVESASVGNIPVDGTAVDSTTVNSAPVSSDSFKNRTIDRASVDSKAVDSAPVTGAAIAVATASQESFGTSISKEAKLLFASSTSTTTYVISRSSVTVLATCFTAVNTAACTGRRRRRHAVRLDNISRSSDLTPSYGGDAPPYGRDVEDGERPPRLLLTLWRTSSSTLTVTTTFTNMGATVSVSAACSVAGVVYNLC